MVQFLVKTMVNFELDVTAKWGASDSELFGDAYTHTVFRYMINSAAEKDIKTRQEQKGCFFQWLVLLPYEATRNIESLLQCLE